MACLHTLHAGMRAGTLLLHARDATVARERRCCCAREKVPLGASTVQRIHVHTNVFGVGRAGGDPAVSGTHVHSTGQAAHSYQHRDLDQDLRWLSGVFPLAPGPPVRLSCS